jgi:hypothetical protein
MDIKQKLTRLIKKLLTFYAKALYYETPIYDEEGNVIGYEWFGIRGGRIETDDHKHPEIENVDDSSDQLS